MHLSRQPSRGMTCSPRLGRENRAGNARIPSPFGTATPCRRMSFIRQGRTHFPRFMQLFGNRDVTHPAQERKLFCSADQAETDAWLDREKHLQPEWNLFFVKRDAWPENTGSMDLVHFKRLYCAGHVEGFFLSSSLF
jgi:hypothetical protein